VILQPVPTNQPCFLLIVSKKPTIICSLRTQNSVGSSQTLKFFYFIVGGCVLLWRLNWEGTVWDQYLCINYGTFCCTKPKDHIVENPKRIYHLIQVQKQRLNGFRNDSEWGMENIKNHIFPFHLALFSSVYLFGSWAYRILVPGCI
jgi:hypothetical protein